MSLFPPFPGLRPAGLQFLLDLKEEAHQDRTWFNARKPLYTDELRWPMRCLVADVLGRLAGGRAEVYGEPSKSVYRIYRDVRFAKDKRPYQTHVACKLTVDPGLSEKDGVVYVHVEPPDQYFMAAGLYQPPVKRLRPLRQQMVAQPAAWFELVAGFEGKGLEMAGHGQPLKRMPKGFAAYEGEAIGPYLKWTSLLLVRSLDEGDVCSPVLAEKVTAFAQDVWPLLDFIRAHPA